jgi:hypothetical protein
MHPGSVTQTQRDVVRQKRAKSSSRPSPEAPPIVTKRAGGCPSGAFLLLKPVCLLAVPFQGGPSESDGASSPEPVPQKIESLLDRRTVA